MPRWPKETTDFFPKFDLAQKTGRAFTLFCAGKESRKGAAICRGVDMTGEAVKILLLLLIFGSLEAAMRVQPVVLKRRSQGRRPPS
jgi:hypothetical protein